MTPDAPIPTPSPAIVASSNRADTRPRRPSSRAVAMARKPRMLGMLAAVAAPSSTRVPPRISRLLVKPVISTATAPNSGPNCMTRWWPSLSDSNPKKGETTSSVDVEGGVDDGKREGADLGTAVILQVAQVVGEQAAGQCRAESERERAEQDVEDRAVHWRLGYFKPRTV